MYKIHVYKNVIQYGTASDINLQPNFMKISGDTDRKML